MDKREVAVMISCIEYTEYREEEQLVGVQECTVQVWRWRRLWEVVAVAAVVSGGGGGWSPL